MPFGRKGVVVRLVLDTNVVVSALIGTDHRSDCLTWP